MPQSIEGQPSRVGIAWFWPVLVLCLLAAMFYARAWPKAPYQAPDSRAYLAMAQDLADGHLDKPHFRTPGYPLFLLVVGAAEEPGRRLFLVQILLHAASVFLICGLLSATGVPRSMVVVVAFVGLLPPFVQTSAWVLTETLTQFCLVLGVSCTIHYLKVRRRPWLVGASLAFAYAALTRPSFQPAALLIGLILYVSTGKRSRLQRAADTLVLLSATLLSAAMYSAYCRARLGNVGITSRLGMTLAVRATPLYPYLPDPTTRRILIDARNEAFTHDQWVDQSVYRAQPELLRELRMTEPQLDAWLRSQSLSVIRQHPIQYAEAVAGSFARIWFPNEGRLPLLRGQYAKVIWYGIHFAVVGLLAFGGVGFVAFLTTMKLGVPMGGRDRDLWTLWILSMTLILYNALISCMLDIGDPRHRASTELLMLAAAVAGLVGVHRLWSQLKSTSPRWPNTTNSSLPRLTT